MTYEMNENSNVPNKKIAAPIEMNFELKLKARSAVMEKLKKIQELRDRNESLGELFEVLLDEYFEKHSPVTRIERRRQQTEKNMKMKNKKVRVEHYTDKIESEEVLRPKITRYIPQVVREQLFRVYNGQCAFVAQDGTRCGCRNNLEVDPAQPYETQGSNEAKNLRLVCPTHNRIAMERSYGKGQMAGTILRAMVGT